MADQPAAAYPPHDCTAWNTVHYCSQGDTSEGDPRFRARYEMCGVCGRILRFRFSSVWMRMKNLW